MNKKIISLFLLGLTLFLAFNLLNSKKVSAEENDQTISIIQVTDEELNSPIVDDQNLQILETDGSITIFDNIRDMRAYSDFEKLNDNSYSIMTGTRETLVGTQIKKMQFLSYSKHTKEWAPVEKYILESGKSYSFSSNISTKWGNVVGVSFSHKSSVSRVIPANKAKMSKLAGYADLEIKRYKVTQPNVTTFYVTRVKKTNTYIKPRYQ